MIEMSKIIFSDGDVDHDGNLSWSEWRDIMSDGKPRLRSDPDAEAIVEKSFATIDVNGDRLLSHREVEEWLLRFFDCADANRDGKILMSELEKNEGRCLVTVGGVPAWYTDSGLQ